jgi:hypothetical protein
MKDMKIILHCAQVIGAGMQTAARVNGASLPGRDKSNPGG